MLWDAVGIVVALVIILLVGGFGLLVVGGVVYALAEGAVEFYHKHFGTQPELRRIRESLTREERELFDEAMERLKIEGAGEEEPEEFPDERV